MAKVKDLMSKHIVGVSVDTTVDNALKLMKSMHVTLMPVISEGRLDGVIFEKDFDDIGGQSKVGKIMRKPVFVEANSDMEEAAKKMVENSVGRLPVVNSKSNMHCVGIISSTDIVKRLK